MHDLNKFVSIKTIFINRLEREILKSAVFSPLEVKQLSKRFTYNNVSWLSEYTGELSEMMSYHHVPDDTQGSSRCLVSEDKLIFSGDSFLTSFIKAKCFSNDDVANLKKQVEKNYPGFVAYPVQATPFIT